MAGTWRAQWRKCRRLGANVSAKYPIERKFRDEKSPCKAKRSGQQALCLGFPASRESWPIHGEATRWKLKYIPTFVEWVLGGAIIVTRPKPAVGLVPDLAEPH